MNNPLTSLVIFACVILTGFLFAVPEAQAQAVAQTQTVTQSRAQSSQAPAVDTPTESESNEVKFPNGVIMEVVRAADGPKPPPNAIVEIQYIGHLEDGTEFGRSYSRRSPAIYALSDVIGCWQTGIPEMNVGSKAKFVCPPGSGNGRRPVDFIWGDTTLYFVIELIAIVG
jgi:FKBP-type peptidyl-prolyl cis-trans isomerase